VITRDEVLKEIRRTAVENGGKALGRRSFFAATGIRESDWMGHWWTTWGEAVREAGFEPRRMNPRLDDEIVLLGAARIVQQYGHFPTAAEIRLACSSDSTLPSHNTFSRFGGLDGLRARLATFSAERGLPDVVALLQDEIGPTTPHDLHPRDNEDAEELPDGFVYLIKSGRHFKIGKANSIDQRHRQLRIQLPQPAEIVHRIKTDDPYGIEAYWHRRYAEKRLNGEWFALSADDVKAFKRRKFM
jgi:hypothetical protein